ncbi:phytoene desaturase family protein [Nocardioides gilvus]|uniref:phytoene desaturase family protein n=1 Tax=Nocardioides gilvus TaxID=1735589 RepID=UPI000D749F3B|nr:NAD(P)/FAD-dependent oxidoreductase [Nocardioides gilvus]
MSLTDLVIGATEPAPDQTDGHWSGEHWDAVVIGAGLGGLSTAAFLATNSQRVLVLEQHRVVGGNAQAHRPADTPYDFDVGVHHVGECEPGGRMRTLTDALGIGDQIEWLPLDPDGFSTITLPEVRFRVPVGWEAYVERLVATFPAEEAALRRCVGVLREVAAQVRAPHTTGWSAGAKAALSSPTTLRWGRRRLAKLFDTCGLSPNARAVIAGESGGYALPPSKAPVAVHAGFLAHHLTSGAWYPRGGGQVLPARLTQTIQAHGGVVRTDVKVDRIMVEGGRAIGVTLVDGTEIHAGAVVSNADPKRTYLGLVGREHLPPRLLRRAESWTMALPLFTVHLAVDIDLRERLPNTTQWIHPDTDVEASYEAAYAGRIGDRVPVLMTSRTLKDPSGAQATPHGQSVLTLVAVAPSDRNTWALRAGGPSAGERYSHHAGYLDAKERLTESVIDTACLVIPDLRAHIVHREAATPVTQERFTLATDGSAYGLELASRQIGRFRPDVKSPIPGLFLTGAGTRHLHGVVGTLYGGAGTAGAILGRDLYTEMAAGAVFADPSLRGRFQAPHA